MQYQNENYADYLVDPTILSNMSNKITLFWLKITFLIENCLFQWKFSYGWNFCFSEISPVKSWHFHFRCFNKFTLSVAHYLTALESTLLNPQKVSTKSQMTSLTIQSRNNAWCCFTSARGGDLWKEDARRFKQCSSSIANISFPFILCPVHASVQNSQFKCIILTSLTQFRFDLEKPMNQRERGSEFLLFGDLEPARAAERESMGAMHKWRLLNSQDYGPPPSHLSVPNSPNLPSFGHCKPPPSPSGQTS